MPRRNEQLARELRDLVGTYLRRTAEFPRDTLVTVTRADVQRNAQSATIWISVLPEERGAEVLALLERSLFDLQGEINRALARRVSPRIRFALDPSPARLDRIDQLSHGTPVSQEKTN